MDNNNTTLSLEKDARSLAKLKDFTPWVECRKRLNNILDTAENGTIREFFGPQVAKEGNVFSRQNFANVAFTSAGNVRNFWEKYEKDCLRSGVRPAVYDFLVNYLVPLSPEEIKARAEKEKHEAEIATAVDSYFKAMKLTGNTPTIESVTAKEDIIAVMFNHEVYEAIIARLEKAEEAEEAEKAEKAEKAAP